MPNKVDVRGRCADVLAALARTANVRLTLKECGISHYWAYKRRKCDPDFDARWRTAVRNGRRALAAAAALRARDAGAARPGEAAKLTLVGSSGKGTLRLEREKPCSFTAERRARFLDALRATCNVQEAAKAVRLSPKGAYRCYHEDAGFREAWEAALAEGRVHLEMALIGAARALFKTPDEQAHAVVGPENVTGMDAKVALQVLKLHRPVEERGRSRRWIKPADPEETRREFLAKIEAVRSARGRDGDQMVEPSSLVTPGLARGPASDGCEEEAGPRLKAGVTGWGTGVTEEVGGGALG